MEKRDFKKEFKQLYGPNGKIVTGVDVPKMNYLMIDGAGSPGETNMEFQLAIEALFSLSYTIKFYLKKNQGIDYGVMPLEGLWWAENMADFDPETGNRNNWRWTLMIMQPEFVTNELVMSQKSEVMKKKSLAAIDRVRFEALEEGKSAQIMHIGPFAVEGPNVQRIHDFIAENGGVRSSKHHEIYLSDFRRVNPEKMKTILRQPYK